MREPTPDHPDHLIADEMAKDLYAYWHNPSRPRVDNLEDPELQEAMFANFDYLEAFRREVVGRQHEHLALHGEDPLFHQLAHRSVRLVHLTEERGAPNAELVPLNGYGFGINLRRNNPESNPARLLGLLNATFMYDDDLQTRVPRHELDQVVLPGRRYLGRDQFEWLWCMEAAKPLAESEPLAQDIEVLFDHHFQGFDTLHVHADGAVKWL